jgi:hypothetical protein
MSIPSDKSSSERLLRYARYHVAALKADPLAAQLAEAAQVEVTALTQRHRSRLEAEDVFAESEARLDRAEFELDDACRRVELEVLASVGKNRQAAEYRATFPQGLTAFVAARGEVQVRQIQALVAALRARIPSLGETRGPELEQLGAKLVEAERSSKTSLDALTTITLEERLARSNLVRQLYKNRAGLGVLYPQDRRRVASFFPPRSREGDEPESDDPENAPTE